MAFEFVVMVGIDMLWLSAARIWVVCAVGAPKPPVQVMLKLTCTEALRDSLISKIAGLPSCTDDC